MSFLICIGRKYGGFYFFKGKASYRLCLGWIAFTYFSIDIENVVADNMSND